MPILANILIAVAISLSSPYTMVYNAPQSSPQSLDVKVKEYYIPTSQQEIWLSALEWCESNGKHTAINPKDLDGTPSYGAYQFKPSTFDLFSKKYNVQGELMDRDTQRLIVSQMINDNTVRWEQQFPACTKKLGRPPK